MEGTGDKSLPGEKKIHSLTFQSCTLPPIKIACSKYPVNIVSHECQRIHQVQTVWFGPSVSASKISVERRRGVSCRQRTIRQNREGCWKSPEIFRKRWKEQFWWYSSNRQEGESPGSVKAGREESVETSMYGKHKRWPSLMICHVHDGRRNLERPSRPYSTWTTIGD